MRSGSEKVMKVVVGFKDDTSNMVKEAVKGFDTFHLALGRGMLKIWLMMLARDLQGGAPEVPGARRKAENDDEL
jgi:hypothetical protein